LEEELHQLCDYFTSVINPHVADGVTVMSLSASLEHRTSDTRDFLCQIVLTETYHILSMPNHVKLKIIA